jgi:hypothetical protein
VRQRQKGGDDMWGPHVIERGREDRVGELVWLRLLGVVLTAVKHYFYTVNSCRKLMKSDHQH